MIKPAVFVQVAPVFPVRDVGRALELYRRLGFVADAYDERAGSDPVYGFLKHGPVAVHLARTPELDCAKNTSACYLYVDDAPALYGAWKSSGVDGRFTEPEDTPYHLREFTYLDPDGNLWRVGSEMQK
jgi:glyoxalase/bleomycin resistance protein/dioxygenase superfamily protein